MTIPDAEFNYQELDVPATHDQVVQQRVRHLSCVSCFLVYSLLQVNFDKLVNPAREQLEEKYPIDNHPLLPGTRIYSDKKTGAFWELTVMRLNVWASHLVCNVLVSSSPCHRDIFTGTSNRDP
jgi:hypothetical protein